MNYALEIAKRLHYRGGKNGSVSHPAVKIAMIGIAVGLTVMLLSVSIVLGFKHAIRDKVIDFGAHIQITNYDNNSSFETRAIRATTDLRQQLMATDNVASVESFATKPGILKTDDNVQGIIVKGLEHLRKEDGTLIDDPKGSLVSRYLADLMELEVGDSYFAYFVQDDGIRARKLNVSGIYCTHFEKYDQRFILCQLPQIQQLNNWDSLQVSGIEVRIKDYDKLNETATEIYYQVANKLQADGSSLLPMTTEQLNPEVFDWLEMLDINVWIILTLMILVAGFNVISGLLILILERTNMIGILKALGARNWAVRKIFLYQAALLIGKGMLWGNLIGIGIILLQCFTHIIPLDADTYYISYVPTEFNLLYIILINIGTFLLSLLMLIVPSYIVSRISPANSIRFE